MITIADDVLHKCTYNAGDGTPTRELLHVNCRRENIKKRVTNNSTITAKTRVKSKRKNNNEHKDNERNEHKDNNNSENGDENKIRWGAQSDTQIHLQC